MIADIDSVAVFNEPPPLQLTFSEKTFWEKVLITTIAMGHARDAVSNADKAVRALRERYNRSEGPYR